MEISRPDISGTELTPYTVDERFLKIPVENYLEEEGIIPNGPQYALLNAINSPNYRFIVGCIGRRVGKSYVSFNMAFLKALEPNTTVLIMAPSYSLSSIGFQIVGDLIKKYSIETLRYNHKDREIEMANGSLIKVGSVTQIDACVGRSYSLIVFDECALNSKGGDGFNTALRPTLDKPGSKAVFISTPRGSNFFKEFYERGFSDSPAHASWVSVHGTVYDNPRASMEDINEAKANNTKAVFEQEYLGSFSNLVGAIYGFSADTHVLTEPEYQNLLALQGKYDENFAGVDIGFRDATAGVVVHYQEDTETFYVIDEYERAEATTAQHAEKIIEWEREYDLSYIFVDAAAAQTMHDFAQDYDLTTQKAKKSVLEGINFVDALLHRGKLKVSPHCTKTIEMLLNYRWDTTSETAKERPVHDKYSHIADALRYALYSFNR